MASIKTKNQHLFKKSFALMELMLAALFLTIIFLSLITSFIACLLLNESNRNLSIATTHAQYIMEEIKDSVSTVNGFDNLRVTVPTQWNWSESGDFTSRGLSYLSGENINVTFSDAVSGGVPNSTSQLLDVRVTVNWLDRARNHNVALETFLNEP